MKIKPSQHIQLNRGILCGVGDRIDEWLKCSKRFQTKSAFHELYKRNGRDLEPPPLGDMYGLIGQNWNGESARSIKLWSLRANEDCAGTRAEVALERAIVGLNLTGCEDCWANQVPTSSGLSKSSSDRHRNVDLIRCSASVCEFIELKVSHSYSHPVYAAMEILCYGLLYLFCREKKEKLEIDTEILRAASVHLRVLAPADFYDKQHTEWLREFERVINSGIAKFAASHFKPLEMNFRFDQFPDGFQWPSLGQLEKAVRGIHRAFPE